MKRLLTLVLLASLIAAPPLFAKKKAEEPAEPEPEGPLDAATFSGLTLRSIGPAVTSGRISDIAVHPDDRTTWYVAAASGGVWKTENAAVTWTPLFDGEGSFSIGCITIDPANPLVIWVGTGENNSQRSVSYGDGVYKSVNGGQSWKNVGLGNSEHIGRIAVDPRDGNTVYVAAQGPLWKAGGDRGLYKTTDGGATWEAVLTVGENTGVNDVVLDPRNPDVLYASTYQRRRHTWVLIDGGPEGGIHKSTDGGASWEKLEGGLPSGDVGRVGLAISPANPDVIYAVVEAAGEEGGFYRSTDAGACWEKRSEYVSDSPQYYNELTADPQNVDRVYAMDTWMQVTHDGGASFERVGGYSRHVDAHALWIDPEHPAYMINGNDGGVYESFDRGATWRFMANLPVTQFYKATADNDFPFYNVYGGTQDNATLGGPARNTSANGITNADWYVTVFGDGFKTQVDPKNPDIVYSQWQHGGLVRYDRKSGEAIDIQPQPAVGEEPLRWNWNSPLIISPHSRTRLYFACQRIFRSDDRGDSWTAVSPDLTRQIDRNTLPVMGKVWSIDAVAKNDSTSFYGNIVSLAESPLAEGLIYAGTDDGLLQVTEDAGESWRRVESLPGVPGTSYVSCLTASLHDANTVFAAFDNHKQGDFTPYLLKSTDRGASWSSIAGDLPERGQLHSVVEDHEKPELLFAGTEFGAFFTVDGGSGWIELTGGMPTVAVREIDIQRRENDLVLGTFGRGFYILDDYSPLRLATGETLEQDTLLFPVKQAWVFHEEARLGLAGKAFQGDGFYRAENPPFGAVFTYYLKDGAKTRKEARQEEEKEREEKGEMLAYPDWDAVRAEVREEDPEAILTISDAEGNVVRRLSGPASKGIHRVAWDLRLPAAHPTNLSPESTGSPWDAEPQGPMAVPGEYQVSLAWRVDGAVTELAGPEPFKTAPLGTAGMPAQDLAALDAFQKKTAELQRAVLGSSRAVDEAAERLTHLKQALTDTPGADPALGDEARALEARLRGIEEALSGDRIKASHNEPVPPSITARVDQIVSGHWSCSSAPTQTHLAGYEFAAGLFEPVLADLQRLIEVDLAALEEKLEAAGGPWTPGRVPRWSR